MKVRNTEIVYLFVSLLGAQINKEHILVNDWIVDTNKSVFDLYPHNLMICITNGKTATLLLVLVVIVQKMLCF